MSLCLSKKSRKRLNWKWGASSKAIIFAVLRWTLVKCLTIDCYWKSIPIDNHSNRRHQLVIDYQYHSLNWYLLVLIDIDCHWLSISSIGYPEITTSTTSAYRVFSLTWPAFIQIYCNKRKRLHKKRVQLPQDLFGTPIWPPWRHVKTLYNLY